MYIYARLKIENYIFRVTLVWLTMPQTNVLQHICIWKLEGLIQVLVLY